MAHQAQVRGAVGGCLGVEQHLCITNRASPQQGKSLIELSYRSTISFKLTTPKGWNQPIMTVFPCCLYLYCQHPGKTLLAKAIACNIDANFLKVRVLCVLCCCVVVLLFGESYEPGKGDSKQAGPTMQHKSLGDQSHHNTTTSFLNPQLSVCHPHSILPPSHTLRHTPPRALCCQVVSSAIVDKYIGESARVIREMFGYAREHQVRRGVVLAVWCVVLWCAVLWM